MNSQDIVVSALCIWRENRGGRPQPDAMQSVMNVIQNRMKKTNDSAYKVCTTHLQFSSIVLLPFSVYCFVFQNTHWRAAATQSSVFTHNITAVL